MADIYNHLLQITGPEGDNTFELPAGATVFGRHPDADYVLHNSIVSSRHARFDCTDDSCTITDLKSTNGTTVNGQKLTPQEPRLLDDGDSIVIEPFKLTYSKILIEQEEALAFIADVEEPEPDIVEEAEIEADPLLDSTSLQAESAPPPPPPPTPPEMGEDEPEPEPESYTPPPGLNLTDSHYIKYLPDIYHTKFMSRFLALFESIALPIEWSIENFDLYLHARTAPAGFLPWLANWFDLTFDKSWGIEQRRTLLVEAHEIYDRRGTLKALSRVLEIYTGQTPQIDDLSEDLEPFTFTVTIPHSSEEMSISLLENLINQHKPAFTNYQLFVGKRSRS